MDGSDQPGLPSRRQGGRQERGSPTPYRWLIGQRDRMRC